MDQGYVMSIDNGQTWVNPPPANNFGIVNFTGFANTNGNPLNVVFDPLTSSLTTNLASM
jgi:hypothetical protein